MAKTNTAVLSETPIDVKLMPTGESPKNNPINPAKPKLKATDSTSISITSSLFLPKNNRLTRQYPGRKAMNMKLTTYRTPTSNESLGTKYVVSKVKTVNPTMISNHLSGFRIKPSKFK